MNSRNTPDSKLSSKSPLKQSDLRSFKSSSNSKKAKSLSSSTKNSDNIENILFYQLVGTMKLILKASLNRSSHDPALLQNLERRAIQNVEEDLRNIESRLMDQFGPSSNHRITSFSHLSSILLKELEDAAVISDYKLHLSNLKENNFSLKSENINMKSAFNEELARKDQQIKVLEEEIKSLEFKNSSLIKALELMTKEMEKSSYHKSVMQQSNIEMRFQCIDFKNDIDRRCDKMTENLKSRIGFIPSIVQENINYIKAVKPPGHDSHVKSKTTKKKKKFQKHFLNDTVASISGIYSNNSQKTILDLGGEISYLNSKYNQLVNAEDQELDEANSDSYNENEFETNESSIIEEQQDVI